MSFQTTEEFEAEKHAKNKNLIAFVPERYLIGEARRGAIYRVGMGVGKMIEFKELNLFIKSGQIDYRIVFDGALRVMDDGYLPWERGKLC